MSISYVIAKFSTTCSGIFAYFYHNIFSVLVGEWHTCGRGCSGRLWAERCHERNGLATSGRGDMKGGACRNEKYTYEILK